MWPKIYYIIVMRTTQENEWKKLKELRSAILGPCADPDSFWAAVQLHRRCLHQWKGPLVQTEIYHVIVQSEIVLKVF